MYVCLQGVHYICVYMCIHTYTRAYTYLNEQIYVNTHTQTHTNTSIQVLGGPRGMGWLRLVGS